MLAIKTVKLNAEIVKSMNLQTFPNVKAKDAFVDAVIDHTDLLPCEVDALLAISRFSAKVPGVCWATVATMVADPKTKYGERAFRKGIKGLREKGIVIIHETLRACSGGQGTNIYQLNPEYITKLAEEINVQGVDSEGVQGVGSGRADHENPMSDAVSGPVSEGVKNLYKEYPKNLFKEDIKSYSYSEPTEHSNQVEEEEKATKGETLGDRYNHEVERYCEALGVPADVTKKLKRYFPAEEIVSLWKSIKGGLRNIGERYEDNIYEVMNAIDYTVRRYKKGKVDNFAAYLVGKVKGLIQDRNDRIAEEYAEESRRQWIEERRKFYARFLGLSESEQETEYEGEFFADQEEEGDDLEAFVRRLYAEMVEKYNDADRAFEEVVAEVAYKENMRTFDARYYVMGVIGKNPVPVEVWGDLGGAWA